MVGKKVKLIIEKKKKKKGNKRHSRFVAANKSV